MKNKSNILNRFHEAIRTQHVFIEDEQVYLKRESEESVGADTNFVEWLPTDFQWISATS